MADDNQYTHVLFSLKQQCLQVGLTPTVYRAKLFKISVKLLPGHCPGKDQNQSHLQAYLKNKQRF